MLNLWNERTPKVEEERRYSQLIQLHQLTQKWISALSPKPEEYQLKRFVPPELNQNLWLLEKLRLDVLPPDLSTLVEATSVKEYLDQLEDTIWIVQNSILDSILDSSDSSAILNQLEQVTWSFGKSLAEAYLESQHTHHGFTFKKLFDQIRPNAFSYQEPFILIRNEKSKLVFLWLDHPGSREILKKTKHLSSHVSIHQNGLMGFIYGLTQSQTQTQRVHYESKNFPRPNTIQVEVSTLDLSRR